MTALATAAAPAPADPGTRPRAPRKGRAKLIVGASIVAIYLLIALFAPLLAPYDALAQDPLHALEGPSAAHWLGTDSLGRDQLSRLIMATRINIPVALAATLLPLVLGTAVGVIAGYLGGWFDFVVMRLSDLLQAFPTYILMIVLVAVMGAGVPSILIAFTMVGWVVYARLIRTETLRIRELGYVTAARTSGYSRTRIIVRHILPTAVRQNLIYATSDLIFAVTALAAFSFLGFGIQPPTAEWGGMIAAAQPYILVAPLLTIAPGIVICVLALGLAVLGDGLQDRTAAS